MASINFYLDKADKKGFSPIHLRINLNGNQIKNSTGKKIKIHNFDKNSQRAKGSSLKSNEINHYLNYLSDRANELLTRSDKRIYTQKEI